LHFCPQNYPPIFYWLTKASKIGNTKWKFKNHNRTTLPFVKLTFHVYFLYTLFCFQLHRAYHTFHFLSKHSTFPTSSLCAMQYCFDQGRKIAIACNLMINRFFYISLSEQPTLMLVNSTGMQALCRGAVSLLAIQSMVFFFFRK